MLPAFTVESEDEAALLRSEGLLEAATHQRHQLVEVVGVYPVINHAFDDFCMAANMNGQLLVVVGVSQTQR